MKSLKLINSNKAKSIKSCVYESVSFSSIVIEGVRTIVF